MKILLDENLPRKLRHGLGNEHEVHTVQDKDWLGKRNGELLGLMTLDGFDAFITIDKNIRHQQNLNRFSIKLFVLNAPNNKIVTLRPYIEALLDVLKFEIADQITVVDI